MKVCTISLFRNPAIILMIILLSGNTIAQTGLSINGKSFSVQTSGIDTTSQIMGTNDYYLSTYKLYGTDLRLALHNIIKNHTVVSYASLWTYFQTTDKKANGKVWDMYSDIPDGTPPYEFTFITKQCGNYSGEGDCYNREHSWPKSWFSDATNSPYSDLFHLYPTDGKVNGQRSNYPYGNVSNPTWTSLNGSKLGTNTFPGYGGIAFEPIDAYKGDLARSSMYMSVRYYTEDAAWSTSEGTNKSDLLPWYANLLYSWSIQDTVSQKEIDRNNAIYTIQKNRNPFIDHPEFAAEIWETTMAPSVISVKEMNLTSILIDFSRYLDSTVTVDKQNFIFDNSIGNPTSIQWGVNGDVSKIVITVPLATGTTYAIQLKNLKSINNVAMNDTIITFKSGDVPVELTSFTAKVIENKIKLNWHTATEKNNKGFSVERKLNTNWTEIAFVNGKGTTTEKGNYFYIDVPKQKGNIIYRLKQIDYDGKFTYSKEIEVAFGSTVAKFELLQNYPNPFNPSTEISWQLAVGSHATLKVYDVLGNEVAELVNSWMEAGTYTVTFNASSLSSGIYFYKLSAGDKSLMKKLILIR
ncbi:MAG: endonuclease [Ignavibacteriaceae bacterium]|jgi:endonuclease I|nr:endonuclease [Ignavibacteriaceae bacterium]